MAYRKRNNFRRRRRYGQFRKRKFNRFPLYKKRLNQGTIYSYKETIAGNAISGLASRVIQQTAAAQHIAMEFTLNQLSNTASYQTLYDSYRICKIVVRLIPMITQNVTLPIAAASVLNPGIIGTVIDYDDATALTALTDYEQYSNWKFQGTFSNRNINRIFRPRFRSPVLNSGGATVFAANPSTKTTWFDCAEPSVAHNGFKVYIDPYVAANVAQTWQVFATFYIQFKSVR